MTRPVTPSPLQSKEILVPPQPKETLGIASALKTGFGIATSPFKAGFSVLSFLLAAIVYPLQHVVNKAFGLDLKVAEWFFDKGVSLFKGTFSPFFSAPKMAGNQVDNAVMGRDHDMKPVSVGFEGLAEISDQQVIADSQPGPSPDFVPVSAAPVGAGHVAGRVAGA